MALGAFVLLTGILAFISGTYAISQIFTDYNSITKEPEISDFHIWISSFIGLIYSCMIMAIDREIVSATSKKAVWARIPLAIMIGLVVSTPIELKLFEKKINKHLFVLSQQENNVTKIANDSVVHIYQQKENEIQSKIDTCDAKIVLWQEVMQQELVGMQKPGRTGKEGVGPAYLEAFKNKALFVKIKLEKQKNLAIAKEELQAMKIERGNDTDNQYIEQEYDLLSRYIALKSLEEDPKEGKATKTLGTGIMLLIILLETIPSLMKLLSKPNEYTSYLEGRDALQTARIIAFINVELDEIEQGVANSLTKDITPGLNSCIIR